MAVVLTKHQAPAEYVTRAVVTERGWTQTAVARFLAEPDGTMPNLRYRSSPPIRLYAMERVLAIEGTSEWQEWYAASRRRRAAGLGRASAGGSGEPACGVGGADDGASNGASDVTGGGADGAEGAPAGGMDVSVVPGASDVSIGEGVGAARNAGVRRGRGSNREGA